MSKLRTYYKTKVVYDNVYNQKHTILVYGELIQTNIKIQDSRLIKIIYDRNDNSVSIKQERLNDKNIDLIGNNEFIRKLTGIFEKVKDFKVKNEFSDKNTLSTKCSVALYGNKNIEYNSRTKIMDNVEKDTDFDNYENEGFEQLFKDEQFEADLGDK